MIIHDTEGKAIFSHPIETDDITGAPVLIDFEHHELHEGETFIFTAVNGNLGDGGTQVDLAMLNPTAGTPTMKANDQANSRIAIAVPRRL